MKIRDWILSKGNPFGVLNFSPQHKCMINQSPIDFVLHVGADKGQESYFYEYLGVRMVIWIEPDKRTFPNLEKRVNKHTRSQQIAINKLVSQFDGAKLYLNLYTISGANSVHELNEVRTLPGKSIPTGTRVLFESTTISRIIEEQKLDFTTLGKSLLVLDIQGHELAALKGMKKEHLDNFNLIMCEVSKIEIYRNAATFKEIHDFLTQRNFKLIFEGKRRSYDDMIYKKI